jgi:DNA repair protein RecO (recombination protein O)
MKQINTQAIILRRTDYGEADRILTDYGKLSLIAKCVRRIKSKLAGGIELFSISDISFIRGRSDLGTLVSTRLLTHYGTIVSDVTRTMLGYNLIMQLHKATEDEPDAGYFTLLHQSFAALDDITIDTELIAVWFTMRLLQLDGHMPNLQTDTAGSKLAVEKTYEFSFDDVAFRDIKLLRVGFSGNQPVIIQKITGLNGLLETVGPLVRTMAKTYIQA